ncbi:Neural proliferation differentiation and control protein 1, partial [Paragonimus heterotremus]
VHSICSPSGVTIATALIVSTIFCSVWLLIILKGSRRRDCASGDSVLKGLQNSDDQKLATSAQRYHFAHQKQQMLSRTSGSSEHPVKEETDAETEDIIYECPGLASTTKLEVTNPVFVMSLEKVRSG